MKQKHLLALLLTVGLATPVFAQNFLDNMIDSVKCAGATDKEACKAKSRKDYEDYQARKQGRAPSSGAEGSTRIAAEPQYVCSSVVATGSADVDSAYANVIGTFGFMTLAEKADWEKQSYGNIRDNGFKHRAVPGVMYDMWDTVRLGTSGGQTIAFGAGAKLRKKGTGSEVSAEFCLVPSLASYSKGIEDAFRKVVTQ